MPLRDTLTDYLAQQPALKLAFLFGSLNTGTETFASDLDLAVMGAAPLTAAETKRHIEALARRTGRPVDLVDLQATRGPLLQQILQTGTRIYCTDRTLYAELIKRNVFDQADWMPYYNRILAERREAWIGRSS